MYVLSPRSTVRVESEVNCTNIDVKSEVECRESEMIE